jgi:ribosomal protein L28
MSASIKYSDTLERFISVNVSTNPLKISNTEKLLLYMRDKKKKKNREETQGQMSPADWWNYM